jgi:hypothetical protein
MKIHSQNRRTTTTDATPTIIGAYPLPDNTGGVFRLEVTARNTTTNRTANTVVVFGAQNLAGTAAILSTPAILLTVANGSDAAMAAVVVGVTTSLGSIIINGTGIAATNIEWQTSLSLLGAD